MAEPQEPSNTGGPKGSPNDPDAASSGRRGRAQPLTPELRRFLGSSRTLQERGEAKAKAEADEAATQSESKEESSPPPQNERAAEARRAGSNVSARAERNTEEPDEEARRSEAAESEDEATDRERTERQISRASGPQLRPNEELSRTLALQHFVLILGALVLIGAVFYVGKKFEYWKYLVLTHTQRQMPEAIPKQFANIPADELVEQALTAERSGKLQEAADRFLAAKHKNLLYRGIFTHLGSMAFDHKDYDTADKLFERSIVFREDLAVANFYRGLVATHRHDFPAAERYFEAAANEAPFSSNYFYYWGEVLRLDFHPREAIRRYEQAERRATAEKDQALCRFKARMARLEAAESNQLEAEIEQQRSAGPLSVDWLMTEAALKIRQGHAEEAAQLMRQAHESNQIGLYASFLNDAEFVDACKKHHELAEVCQMDPAIQALFP